MNIYTCKTVAILFLLAFCSSSVAIAQSGPDEPWSFILPEQRCIDVRDPEELCKATIPYSPRPTTVANPEFDAPPRYLTLSDVLNISLQNLEVVRVLGGVSASSTGRTVYDVAISNTQIDNARGAFDPTLRANNSWNRNENPSALFDPGDPARALIVGGASDNHAFDLGLSKRTVTGGTIDFGVNSNSLERRPGVFPLNPQNNASSALSYTQPILRGSGMAVNKIPIVLARIDTERSFFQYKNSIQSHVRSVIEGYWSLVFARTDLWARQQQVAQLEFANNRTQARLETGDVDVGEAAQTLVAYEGFRANLLAAEANVLQREAALRNVLGLPPYEAERLTPVSPLIDEQLDIDWDALLSLAETQRPDIIELKLILEADQQRLLLSRNQALPSLDGVALYRWNGLEGVMPGGGRTASNPGDFEDWNLGVNFSVPLGLRSARSLLRQQELLIQRDRANLQQGLHQAVHNLAINLRNLEQFYQQYERFQAVRAAARTNLEVQLESYNVGRIQFIVVLQAIVDWGNSVSNEAQSLVQYNSELARLEEQTGTILETHGIAFVEERYGSVGPRLLRPQDECYPFSTQPTASVARYGSSGEPSEEFFELEDPAGDKTDRMEDGDVDIEAMDLDNPPVDPNSADDVDMDEFIREREEQLKKSLEAEEQSSKQPSAPIRAARAIRNLFR